MFRFLAFTWQGSHEDRAEEICQRVGEVADSDGCEWSVAYRARGLEIWHAGDRPGRMETIRLPDGGALLGRALSRADGFPNWRPCSLANATFSLDPVKQAEWLVANIWGSYIVFLPQQQGYPLAVLCDPVGGLPCYRVRWKDFDIFTSNIEALKPLPGLDLSINLDALTATILLPIVCKGNTCLNGVQKVLPGECFCVSEHESRTFLWNPVSISQNAPKFRADEAAIRMRDTLVKVVDASIRPYKRVLHSLGGLDSSIVLTCLGAARNPPEVTCVNYHTASFSGDERRYARRMSSHAGVPLVERRLEPERVDLDIWRTQEMGPSPPAMFDCVPLAGDVHALAEQLAVDVLSSGVGGDSVFFEAPYIFPAQDYVATNASIHKLGRTALEAAQHGGRSLAHTAFAMVLEKLRPPPCFDTIIKLLDPGTSALYLNIDELIEWRSLEYLHPMLAADDRFPKGKYYHIIGTSFFNLEGHRYRFSRHSEFDNIFPLLAQPFVELCLQIPTWQLADGGVNRGLARRAFWESLPREISGRISKSTDQGLYEQLFVQNLPALRDALLNGVLAGLGFFNRKQLEIALSEQRDRTSSSDPATFLDLYAWEAWASRWSG